MNVKARSGYANLMRFAVVGVAGTSAHYALLLSLVEVAGVAYLWAAGAGFLLGALVNYVLSRMFVFASDRPHVDALPRFLLVALSGLLLTVMLMAGLVDLLGVHYLLAQVLTTVLLLFWHYLGNALWTFGQQPRPDA